MKGETMFKNTVLCFKTKLLFYLCSAICLLLFLPVISLAEPILYFSDLVNGPKTGLDDGLGSGAIVTVWGKNLGSSQGVSKIYAGGMEVAHVYYWGNADGSALAGPAKLYESHGMQTISFSIASTAADGSGNIYVVVDDVQSNALPFTIRAGTIKHVKTTGSDTNSGSWSSPWRTMDYAARDNHLSPGDIVYFGDGVQETDGFNIRYVNGSADALIGLIAYPGASVLAQGTTFGIGNYSNGSTYLAISKIIVKSDSDVLNHFAYSREIANEVTDITCASCSCGAMGGAARQEGTKFFGNYIHDYGGSCSGNQTHPTYFTLREAVSGKTAIAGFEFAWNYLRDNDARSGIHFYDEHGCGGYTTTVKVHNNVVINQTAAGIDIVAGGCDDGYSMYGTIEIYNNLLIENGKDPNNEGFVAPSILLQGPNNLTDIKLYNNTIYGYGTTTGCSFCEGIRVWNSTYSNRFFDGVWEFENNIIVDTRDIDYSNDTLMKVPNSVGNNLWYGAGAAPSWDSNSVNSDPLFVNPSAGDFHLQTGSPAIDAGSSDVAAVVAQDYDGNTRPIGAGYDIGAYEVVDANAPVVQITSPTADNKYPSSGAFSGTLNLGGTATPSSGRTISSVTCSNSAGGSCSCQNTTSWTCNTYISSDQTNVNIKVTATDSNNSSGIDVLVVNYSASSGGGSGGGGGGGGDSGGGGDGGNTGGDSGGNSGGDSDYYSSTGDDYSDLGSGSGSGNTQISGGGCGFVKDDNGKGPGADGGAATFAIMMMLTLFGIALAKRLQAKGKMVLG